MKSLRYYVFSYGVATFSKIVRTKRQTLHKKLLSVPKMFPKLIGETGLTSIILFLKQIVVANDHDLVEVYAGSCQMKTIKKKDTSILYRFFTKYIDVFDASIDFLEQNVIELFASATYLGSDGNFMKSLGYYVFSYGVATFFKMVRTKF